jgi:uncharacterized membrane protein YfhO
MVGVLPVLYDDQQGNVLYRVPRRYPSLARVVATAQFNALKPPRFNDDVEYLGAYADAIENGPEAPTSLSWQGTDAFRVHAKLDAGQSLMVQETYDPAWRAWSSGKPLVVRKDAMGFMVIDAQPGDQEFELAFVTPLENQVGRVVTVLTLLIIAGLLGLGVRERFA